MQPQLTLDHHVVGGHAIDVDIKPALEHRNRLTSAFRIILAIPHLILVGGPVALALSFVLGPHPEQDLEWGVGGGVLGVGALMIAVIAWFAIVFTGTMPQGLWDFSAFFLRWRVRAAAYIALLLDDYPPFGDAPYPIQLNLPPRPVRRDRLTVAFRLLLALPHLFMVWLLGAAWLVTTICAWFAILFTGAYPRSLYAFAVGVLRWSTDVEAYLLLLHDEFPPFSLT